MLLSLYYIYCRSKVFLVHTILFKIGFDKSRMEENSEKLLFRMQNIIPRGLSSASQNITATSSLTSVQETSALDGPLDFVMEMTFGKIAGTFYYMTRLF